MGKANRSNNGKGKPKKKGTGLTVDRIAMGAAMVAVLVGIFFFSATTPSKTKGQRRGLGEMPSADAWGEGFDRETVCGTADQEHFSESVHQGMHILQLPAELQVDGAACAEKLDKVSLTIHVDGVRADAPAAVQLKCGDSLDKLTKKLKAVVEIERPKITEEWRSAMLTSELAEKKSLHYWKYYTPRGVPISTAAQLLRCGTAYAYQGGNFLWPGIRVGHNFTAGTVDGFGAVKFETMSLHPLVFSVEGLLTETECDHVIKKAAPMMEISPVSHIDSDIGKPASNWRTSTQARLPHGHDPIVNSINTRVAEVIKVSKSHQEPLQVLNYQKGQKYDTHHDFFDPSVYKNQPDMLAMVDQDGSRNRLATLLWYMSTPEAGGETAFPRAGGLARPPDFRCEGAAGQQGIKVPALKGRAVLFYSLRPDGAIDPFSLHGGCPPIGETPKWAVNQWVWSKAYH